MMIKVSVIIPVHNEENTILKLLELVNLQKIPKIESKVLENIFHFTKALKSIQSMEMLIFKPKNCKEISK